VGEREVRGHASARPHILTTTTTRRGGGWALLRVHATPPAQLAHCWQHTDPDLQHDDLGPNDERVRLRVLAFVPNVDAPRQLS
jgi:hypothetical protein